MDGPQSPAGRLSPAKAAVDWRVLKITGLDQTAKENENEKTYCSNFFSITNWRL